MTKEEYDKAIKEAKDLFDSNIKKGTPQGDQLELLLTLIEKYEEEHFSIDAPDPTEIVKFRMEQQNA